MRRTKTLVKAPADRAAEAIESLRPLVQRAMADPEVQEALKKSLGLGKRVYDDVRGKDAADAARKIAKDKTVKREARDAATSLRSAIEKLSREKKRGRRRKGMMTVLSIGGAIAAVVALLPRIKGMLGGGDSGHDESSNSNG
jgi:hypothetical protein